MGGVIIVIVIVSIPIDSTNMKTRLLDKNGIKIECIPSVMRRSGTDL